MPQMETCKTCEAAVAASAKVCPHCGAALKKMGLIKKMLITLCGIFIIIGVATAMSSNSSTQSKVTFGTDHKDANITGVATSFDIKKISIRLETNNSFNVATIKVQVARITDSGSTSTIDQQKFTVDPQSNVLTFSYFFDRAGTFKIIFLNDKTDAVLGEGTVTIK